MLRMTTILNKTRRAFEPIQKHFALRGIRAANNSKVSMPAPHAGNTLSTKDTYCIDRATD